MRSGKTKTLFFIGILPARPDPPFPPWISEHAFSASPFRWSGSPATITASETASDQVYGVLWELALDNLPTLDDQEGVANEVYHRFSVQVTACTSALTHEGESYLDHAGHSVEAFTYQLTPKRLALSPSDAGCSDASKWKKPSRAYKTVIGRGAREHRLPRKGFMLLKAIY